MASDTVPGASPAALIEAYAAGAEAPARAIKGLTREELLAHPVPGTWSIQELVLHLMDSDLVACDRIKRIAAETKPPLLIGYDETAFSKNLNYAGADAVMACEAFRVNRLMTAAMLRSLPAAAWEKWGVHNERGKLTLPQMVAGYIDHLEHHLRFLREKRKALGKPQ
jgi:hypothetical protein